MSNSALVCAFTQRSRCFVDYARYYAQLREQQEQEGEGVDLGSQIAQAPPSRKRSREDDEDEDDGDVVMGEVEQDQEAPKASGTIIYGKFSIFHA